MVFLSFSSTCLRAGDVPEYPYSRNEFAILKQAISSALHIDFFSVFRNKNRFKVNAFSVFNFLHLLINLF